MSWSPLEKFNYIFFFQDIGIWFYPTRVILIFLFRLLKKKQKCSQTCISELDSLVSWDVDDIQQHCGLVSCRVGFYCILSMCLLSPDLQSQRQLCMSFFPGLLFVNSQHSILLLSEYEATFERLYHLPRNGSVNSHSPLRRVVHRWSVTKTNSFRSYKGN